MKRGTDSISKSSGNNKNKIMDCPECQKQFRSDKLKRHLNTHNPFKDCSFCKQKFQEHKLVKHEVLCRDKVNEKHCNRTYGVHQHIENDPYCSSVTGMFNSYTLPIENSSDYDFILREICDAAKEKLENYILKHPVKAQIITSLIFNKTDASGERVESEKVFRSACEPILIGDEINGFLGRAKETIRIGIDVYQRYGSGWIFDKLCTSKLEIAKYSPLSASGSVSIPKKLKNIRSVLNI